MAVAVCTTGTGEQLIRTRLAGRIGERLLEDPYVDVGAALTGAFGAVFCVAMTTY